MTRSVYTLCGFQNLKPVGFCVFCEFCGNYKQRRYKYKSISPINCNLHFYHSIYLMIKKFDWRKIVPIYQDSPYNTDLQRVKGWQMAVWQGGCSRVSAMFILDICHVYVKCMLWYRYLVFVTALQSVYNGAIKPLYLFKQASIIYTSKPLYTCRHFVYCYIGA